MIFMLPPRIAKRYNVSRQKSVNRAVINARIKKSSDTNVCPFLKLFGMR